MSSVLRARGRRGRRLFAVAASATLAAAVVAACGSSSSTKTGTGTGSSGNSASAASVSGSPITVGFIFPSSGVSPFPTEGTAIKGATQYVNTVLGGINGHPIKVDVCQTDDTPETNVNCANTFVQDGVPVVLDGYDYSSGSEQPILDRAGIPLVGVVAGNETVDTAQHDFYFGPSDEAFGTGPLEVFAQQGIKSVAFTAPNTPTDQTYVKTALEPPAKALGLKLTVSYYDPSNTDWTVVADTLKSANAQLVGTVAGSEAQCTSLLQALRSNDVPGKVFLGGCSEFVQQAGKSASTGVESYTALWQPNMKEHAPAVIQQQLDAYAKAMAAVGGSSVTDQHGVAAFAEVVDIANIMKMLHGSVTSASVLQQLQSLNNWQPFLDPPATCNHQQWPGTSTCTGTIIVTKVASDGSWAPASGSGFVPVHPIQ